MIKLAGAAIILIATTWIGVEYSRGLKERPMHLRLFGTALQTLEAEIMYGHAPLNEAARRIAPQMPKPLDRFFLHFAEQLEQSESTAKLSWEAGLAAVWSDTALTETDKDILLQFGENLGKHDRLTQQKQIMLTTSHLEREENAARARQGQYEKMIKSLGFLSGLLLIILLL